MLIYKPKIKYKKLILQLLILIKNNAIQVLLVKQFVQLMAIKLLGL